MKRIFVLLLVEVVLLGGAFGGGFYIEMQKRRAVEKQLAETKQKAEQAEESAVKTLAASRARTQMMEAALGVLYQNYGMAFDRVVRAKALSARVGVNIDKEVDELMKMLTQQRADSVNKLLAVADRLEPAPPLTLPKPPQPGAPDAAATGGAAPATAAKSAAPGDDAATARPVARGDADKDFQEGREALREAKELLLSGETKDLVKKLARAQVLLDDSGHTEVDEDLGAALKAAKSHDEARARTALEAALARLRAR